MGMKVFSIRLDEELVSRVDALGGNRSDFVRGAVAAALGGDLTSGLDVPTDPAKANLKKHGFSNVDDGRVGQNLPQKSVDRSGGSGLRPDDDEVLACVRVNPRRGERALSEVLGWPEIRVSKSLGRLGSAGLVRFSGGVVEAV